MSTFDVINPLLEEWPKDFGVPPFQQIHYSHYKPAIFAAFELHKNDIKSIVENPNPPDFQNVVEKFDTAGYALDRVLAVFHNQCSSSSPPELQAVELELSGPLAEHQSLVYTYPGLFAKICIVYENREGIKDINSNAPLSAEQIRLVERVYLDFVRAGAKFDIAAQERYKVIVVELAELMTKFSQNVLADETNYTLDLSCEEDLAGLPEDIIASAKAAAIERNKPEECLGVITLSRSSVEPFVTYSSNAQLREKAWKAWVSRGHMNDATNNVAIIRKILSLRVEQARMHGYSSFGAYATADTMAQNPQNVMDLLEKVWVPAKESCAREQAAIEEYMKEKNVSVGKKKGSI